VTAAESKRVQRIVVGIDGSPAATAALDWAATMADSTGASVEVIATWQWPTGYGAGPMFPAEYDPADDAARIAREAIDSARPLHRGVEFVALVVEGHASKVLVDASRGAELLALGTRGHGELGGLLLGSVTEHCAAHAHCPVLVFRDGT
jgi:nucleotide-binding universal stress UspA family protein